jgi:hypothetical protein
LRERLLRLIYPKGIIFAINGAVITTPAAGDRHYFKVTIGKGASRPVGIGYLIRSDLTQTPPLITAHGLAISTFGKVIKHGWEWLGLMPKLHGVISGIVEIPELSELLTINKADFLNDAASLKKYYRIRKATQEAVLALLPELGEPREETKRTQSKEVQTLSREIESALSAISDDFPELLSLIGTRRRKEVAAALSDRPEQSTREERIESMEPRKRSDEIPATDPVEPSPERLGLEESASGKLTRTVRKKMPGLRIALQEFTQEDRPALGRIIEDTVVVNTAHPAWKKAIQDRLEEYHIVLTVACLLSEMIEQEHTPVEFINTFLASWGNSLQQKMF